MSCQSISVRYQEPSVIEAAIDVTIVKSSALSTGVTVEKHTQKCGLCCMLFPLKLCGPCRTLFRFTPDGVVVACVSSLIRKICVKCKRIDLAKTISTLAKKRAG